MSNEHENEDGQNTDPLKSLKSEFSRKFENTNSQINQISETHSLIQQQLDQISSHLLSQNTAKSSSQSDNSNDVPDPIDDPQAYARYVAKISSETIEKQTQAKEASNREIQAAYQDLVSLYPDLTDQNSDLYKEADKAFKSSPKQDASAMTMAVLKAAKKVGVKQQGSNEAMSDDEYTGSSSRSKSHRMANKASGSKDDLPAETLAFAQLVGLDVDNPEVKKRLSGHSKRNFSRWNPANPKGGKK